MDTGLIYYEKPELVENKTKIVDFGIDEAGFFIIPQSSCYYQGGGGQDSDIGEITIDDKTLSIHNAVLYNNQIKHYVDQVEIVLKSDITIKIDAERRNLNSRLHSAGHLIVSLLYEDMKLKLLPVKGSHYPYNSAVEFDTDLTPETFDIDQINERLDFFILQDIPLKSQVVSTSSEDYLNSFRTGHFDEQQHAEVRLVKIGDFLSYACGGTHVSGTGVLKGLKVQKIQRKKSRIKIKYGFI